MTKDLKDNATGVVAMLSQHAPPHVQLRRVDVDLRHSSWASFVAMHPLPQRDLMAMLFVDGGRPDDERERARRHLRHGH
eukprot:4285522-Heterocapsa_arctica.AAC.1